MLNFVILYYNMKIFKIIQLYLPYISFKYFFLKSSGGDKMKINIAISSVWMFHKSLIAQCPEYYW